MGEQTDYFRAIHAHRQQERSRQKIVNTGAIEASGFRFRVTNSGETILFREDKKPHVDFYPSTGRWRVTGINKTFSGGAEKFLRWYAEAKV